MDHIGNPECCCEEEECPECCSPTSLKIYMQFNQVDDPEYICDPCPADAFLVEIDEVGCGEGPVSGIPSDFCFYDPTAGGGECESISSPNCDGIDDIQMPTVDCAIACYETSFESDCHECEPTLGGASVFLKSTYEICGMMGRASQLAGGGNPGFGPVDCALVLFLTIKVYGGASCESMELLRIYRYYSVTVINLAIEGACCDIYAFEWEPQCFYECPAASSYPLACLAGNAIGDVEHPEYNEIELVC
jgi:hypothetical protein